MRRAPLDKSEYNDKIKEVRLLKKESGLFFISAGDVFFHKAAKKQISLTTAVPSILRYALSSGMIHQSIPALAKHVRWVISLRLP